MYFKVKFRSIYKLLQHYRQTEVNFIKYFMLTNRLFTLMTLFFMMFANFKVSQQFIKITVILGLWVLTIKQLLKALVICIIIIIKFIDLVIVDNSSFLKCFLQINLLIHSLTLYYSIMKILV